MYKISGQTQVFVKPGMILKDHMMLGTDSVDEIINRDTEHNTHIHYQCGTSLIINLVTFVSLKTIHV